MTITREFITNVSSEEAKELLPQWSWLVPNTDTPLFLSAFGDWVFGNPDGSLWILSVLEGSYERVAINSEEYNELNKSSEWCNDNLLAEWFPIALENGICPDANECIGWKIHPIIGGKFTPKNLQAFSMVVYQSLMAQLHSQSQGK